MTPSEQARAWKAYRSIEAAVLALDGVSGFFTITASLDGLSRDVRDQIARDSVLTSDSLVADLADAGQVDAEMDAKTRKILADWPRYHACGAVPDLATLYGGTA